jgi:hypothetical protein
MKYKCLIIFFMIKNDKFQKAKPFSETSCVTTTIFVTPCFAVAQGGVSGVVEGGCGDDIPPNNLEGDGIPQIIKCQGGML